MERLKEINPIFKNYNLEEIEHARNLFMPLGIGMNVYRALLKKPKHFV